MTDRSIEDPFLDELERVAKGLSVVTDRQSSEALRRLFGELHEDEHRDDDDRGEDRAGQTDVEFEIRRLAEVPGRAR